MIFRAQSITSLKADLGVLIKMCRFLNLVSIYFIGIWNISLKKGTPLRFWYNTLNFEEKICIFYSSHLELLYQISYQSNSFKAMCLQGNVPLRHLLNEKSHSFFKEVNDQVLSFEHAQVISSKSRVLYI